MSDARWFEIEADRDAALRHFGLSVELFRAGGFDTDTLDGYRAQMAFMHAMQSAHTSLETMLLRILDLLREDRPTGADWHADLLARAGRTLPTRPAILSPSAMAAAGETRRFRHVAMRNYGSFDPARAGPALAAAETLLKALGPDIIGFRTAIDPN